MSNSRKNSRADRSERAARMRAEQLAAERRRRQLWISAAAVAVIVVVVLGFVVYSQSTSSVTTGDSAVPAHATGSYGYDVSPDAAAGAPTVVAYEDFMCPVCGAFEQDSGTWLQEQSAAGAIVLEYRPISILDRSSTTDYSTRSANAAACVADEAGVKGFQTMHDALYAQQPEEGSAGLDDDTLVGLAVDAGADENTVSTCIGDGTYSDWVAKATDQASQDGVSATPTVTVDGTEPSPGSVPTLEQLQQAVEAAQ